MPRKMIQVVPMAPPEGAIQVEVTIPVRRPRDGTRAQYPTNSGTGHQVRIPRVSRLMALAIKFQDLVNRGEVQDYADLARLGYVTRARITQIMNLLMLAPDIQEQLLDAPDRITVNSAMTERGLRSVATLVSWSAQRAVWGDGQMNTMQKQQIPPLASDL